MIGFNLVGAHFLTLANGLLKGIPKALAVVDCGACRFPPMELILYLTGFICDIGAAS